MREIQMTLPELALIAGTRAALAAGVALLVADRIPRDRRMAVGWTLVALGAFSTIPLAFDVLGKNRLGAHQVPPDQPPEGYSEQPERLWRRTEPFGW